MGVNPQSANGCGAQSSHPGGSDWAAAIVRLRLITLLPLQYIHSESCLAAKGCGVRVSPSRGSLVAAAFVIQSGKTMVKQVEEEW